MIRQLPEWVSDILAWIIVIIMFATIIYGLLWGIDKLWRMGFGQGPLDPAPIAQRCANPENIQQYCIDYRVSQCMATERYTLDQCVRLVGK